MGVKQWQRFRLCGLSRCEPQGLEGPLLYPRGAGLGIPPPAEASAGGEAHSHQEACPHKGPIPRHEMNPGGAWAHLKESFWKSRRPRSRVQARETAGERQRQPGTRATGLCHQLPARPPSHPRPRPPLGTYGLKEAVPGGSTRRRGRAGPRTLVPRRAVTLTPPGKRKAVFHKTAGGSKT